MLEKLSENEGRILLWIQENVRGDIWDPIVKGITYLGEAGALMIITAIVLTVIPKTRRLGILCMVSLAVSFVINNLIIKNMVERIRPYDAVAGLNRIVGKQPDWSFPSGHSASGFSVASVLSHETNRRIGISTLVLALLIALSRLYVGVHYPTDVLCGMMTGTLIGLMTCFVYHKKIAKNNTRLHR